MLESLVRSVIDASTSGDAPAARYEAWAKANTETLHARQDRAVGIERLDNPNIAALSVALRTLRSVIRVGAST